MPSANHLKNKQGDYAGERDRTGLVQTKMTGKEFCKRHGLTEDQFYGREKYSGRLYLSDLTSIPDGFSPIVSGGLYLSSLTSIPDGFSPTVGGDLYLSSLTSIPDGFNPTVGGGLYLSGLTSIPDGFSPTVGGDLYLSNNLTSIPDGFNPIVGGDLYLSNNLTSIPDGFSPTVGGRLYLRSHLTANRQPFNNRLLTWRDGKYIQADGIFTEVVSKKGRVYTVKNIGSDKHYYLVTDGRSTHAHGKTIEQAKTDFKFKQIAKGKGGHPQERHHG